MDAYHRLQLVGLTSLFSPTVGLLAAGGLSRIGEQLFPNRACLISSSILSGCWQASRRLRRETEFTAPLRDAGFTVPPLKAAGPIVVGGMLYVTSGYRVPWRAAAQRIVGVGPRLNCATTVGSQPNHESNPGGARCGG